MSTAVVARDVPDARARRGRPALTRRVELSFLALILVMAAHEAEHVGQLLQKKGLENSCPQDCRGALGFVFDVEWVHFAYNSSILIALGVFWWLIRPGVFSFLSAAVAVQAYHAVEHVAKIDQWLENGHRSPTPGILGKHLQLVELHFTFNTVVFMLALAAFFEVARRERLFAAAAVAFLLLLPVPVALATRTPTTHLEARLYDGPLVIDDRRKVIGQPGTVVRGGIQIVKANGVLVRDVAVVGGRHGIQVTGSTGVVLDGVAVRGSELDGISARGSSVTIRDCVVHSLLGAQAQGIDISFGMTKAPSKVEGCTVIGGYEGIVTHFAHADLRGNRVSATKHRGITMTEMSMGHVEENEVSDAIGVGIFCGDYSACDIHRNVVVGTRRDSNGGRSRAGYAIQALYGASATVNDNRLARNAEDEGAFINAEIVRD
jgi:Right handed beta helix region